MQRLTRYSLAALCVLAGTAGAEPRSPRLVRAQADAIPGRYIVVMKGAPPSALPAADRAGAHAAIDRLAAAHGARIEHRYVAALHGFAAEMTEAAALAIADDPGVAYVEEDSIVRADAVQTMPTWGLDRIDQRALPVDGKFVQLGDGEGTTVFVIDSGIRSTHTEFTGRILPGANAIQDGRGVEDCAGHGSHVAGTIAGTTFGVAKKAKIVPVRVLDCAGSGALTGVIAGIDFVTQNKRPSSVANLSLGGPVNETEDTAIRNLIAAGVTVVLSAGNNNADSCTQSPARVREAITVGATSDSDARAGFSNFGTCVDVHAPGVAIVSAAIASDTASIAFNGTSMAAPHVAGVAAAFLSRNPGATPAQVTAALLAGATRDKVTDPKGSPNLLLHTAFVDTIAPEAAFASPQNGARLQASFVVEATASDVNLDRVELAVDGSLIGSVTAPPFRFEISGLAAGAHTLELTAFDLAGLQTAQTINVTVGGDADPGEQDPGEQDPGEGEPGGSVSVGCTAAGGGAALPLLLLAVGAIARRRRRG